MCLYLSEEATQYLSKVTEVIFDATEFDTYFENSERFMMENCEVFTGEPRSMTN